MNFFNKHSKIIPIFNIALLVAAFVLNLVYMLNNSLSTINVAANIICLCAIIAGLFYILKDYKKQAANYYKAYIALYVLSRLVYTIAEYSFSMTYGASYLSPILNTIVIVFGISLLLKDLGKNTSLIFAWAMLALVVIDAILSATVYFNSIFYNAAPALSTTCAAVLFVLAKYADKQSRGVK